MKRFFTFLLVSSLTLAAGYYAYMHAHASSQEVTLIVERGSGIRDTSALLATHDVINMPTVFAGIAYLSGKGRKFQAGEYAFPAGITPHQVMEKLARGDVVIRKITIPEGWTVRDIVKRLQEETALMGQVPERIIEGTLLPDTYRYSYGDERAEMVQTMRRAMQETMEELWPKRDEGLPFSTPEEALTLASIVERETGVAEERARVAAVYVNRLRIGMKLQADPTVVYGIEKETGVPMNRALTIADLERATAYNTYVYPGLPPGPIANPGRDAIEATLHPLTTNELYFVADGKGGHRFASSLEEHNRNVAEYRKAMSGK